MDHSYFILTLPYKSSLKVHNREGIPGHQVGVPLWGRAFNLQSTCWFPTCQPFKFDVFHRTGADMAVVDFLSCHTGVSTAGQVSNNPESGGEVCGSRGMVSNIGEWRVEKERVIPGKSVHLWIINEVRFCSV